MRKTTIVVASFLIGIVSTVFAAATYDATIQSRATSMFNAIKSNADVMDPRDVSSYYTLVHLNILSLIQVLTSLDTSITAEIEATAGITGETLLNQINNDTGTDMPPQNEEDDNNSTNENPDTPTVSNSNTVTVILNQGILYCGNPDRNDYTSYSPVDKKVIIKKDYCKSKGGKVWASCDQDRIHQKVIDTIKDGDNFSCSDGAQNSVNTPGTTPVSNNNGGIVTKKVSVKVAGGTNISCGDPSRSDYTVFSDEEWQSNRTNIVDKVYCNQKGGFIWNTCNQTVTNKKSVDTLKDGDSFSCPTTNQSNSNTNGGVNGAVAAGTINNTSDSAGTLEIIRTPVISSGLAVEGTTFLITWKTTGAIRKISYTCKVNNEVVAATTGLSSIERIQGRYSASMIGTNYCEWVGRDANGTSLTKAYEQFVVTERTPTEDPSGSTSHSDSTTANTEEVTITAYNGVIACGNPDRNDYTTYGVDGNKVIINKIYCNEKGGYVWIVCNGKATNIKSADITKDGDVFTCQTPTSGVGGSSSNAVPTFSITRSYNNDGQYVEWSSTNARTITYSCSINGTETKSGSVELNSTKKFTGWSTLHDAGWPKGKYNCTWKITGATTIQKIEDFYIL